MASFKAKFPVLQELFAKNHRGGGLWAPLQRGEGSQRDYNQLLFTKSLNYAFNPCDNTSGNPKMGAHLSW